MGKEVNVFFGFDLGASSVRAILGLLRNDRLELKEIHRFPNQPMEIPALVARSVQQEHYQPCDTEEWDRQFKRYQQFITDTKGAQNEF